MAQIMREYYPTHALDELCKMLPKRTRTAISRRAAILGVRKEKRTPKPSPSKSSSRMTRWEKEIIFDFGPYLTLPELKFLLPKRSLKEIYGMAEYFDVELHTDVH